MEKLAKRLKVILMAMEKEGHSFVSPEIRSLVKELQSVIEAVEESKCSNGMFCGLDKKW